MATTNQTRRFALLRATASHRHRRLFVAMISLGLFIAISPAVANGQASTNEVVFKNIYKAIMLSSSNPNGDAPTQMTAMWQPGVAIDPWLDLTLVEDRQDLTRVLDAISDPLWLTKQTGSSLDRKVSAVYLKTLDYSQWALTTLSVEQKKKFDEAKKILYSDSEKLTPTEGYSTYTKYKKIYIDALAQLNSVPPEQQTAAMKQAVQEAHEDLTLVGDEKTYVGALSTYNGILVLLNNEWLKALKATWASGLETTPQAKQYAPVGISPSFAFVLNSSGWRHVTIQNAEKYPSDQDPLPEIGIKDELKLWRWSDGSLLGDKDQTSNSEAKKIQISFDYIRCSLDRGWIDERVYASRSWRWNPDSHLPLISDGGDPSKKKSASGLMPAIPASIVLVRNVMVEGEWPEVEITRLRKLLKQSKAVSWGPFALGGLYSTTAGAAQFRARPTPKGFRLDDVQIIAWDVRLLPLCPNPDPGLKW